MEVCTAWTLKRLARSQPFREYLTRFALRANAAFPTCQHKPARQKAKFTSLGTSQRLHSVADPISPTGTVETGGVGEWENPIEFGVQ